MRALSIFLLSLSMAGVAWGRGGGGCLQQGTLIATPAGQIPVERLQRGDTVWSVVDSRLQPATVQAVTEVDPTEYVELTVAGRTLRATPEHPLQIAPGTFQAAGGLQVGDHLEMRDANGFQTARIDAISRVKALRSAFNLLVTPGGTYLANDIVVHNKGCFLPDTPILRADGTEAPVSEIRPGDALLAFTAAGEIVHTTVRGIITHDVDEYLMVGTERVTLRVTREHPFYTGNGTFKTLEGLRIGDPIFVLLDGSLRPERIVSLETVHAPTRVYNLQTDQPNTFFAHGVAVHNKGGGCFPAGTRISTPRGEVAIETLNPGDEVLAIDAQGGSVRTLVEAVHRSRSALWVIETGSEILRTTREHPLLTSTGAFRVAGDFEPGDQIVGWRSNQLRRVTVRRLTAVEGDEEVFTLRVGWPHTFVADGFVVHNKGGGGFGGGFGGGYHGGGYHGGGSSGGGSGDPTLVLILIGGIIVVYFIVKAVQNRQQDEDLDFSYNRGEIERKAVKTRKLLEFLSRVDSSMAPDQLEERARSVFTKLQQCWQARDYEPMKPLLMPDLYAEHCAQIAGMIRNHEINMIGDLRIEQVDIVNVRYPQKENDREFTALISAVARDYYVDSRTGSFLRGDDAPARFQEFWTFHRQDSVWLLREIDQTRESNALKEENVFEQFTDLGLTQVYGDKAAEQSGPAGPWLEKETEGKATRTERLLNFLVQTDKLWDRTTMLERARKVFLDVMLARESGDPASVPTAELFPDVAASLQGELVRLGSQGTKLEFRNLCVRKVELVLVRNFSDNSKDEFTVRISAHAQRAVRRGGLLINQDPYVTPFAEFWTLGRLSNEWKLKAVQPPAQGEETVRTENVDEDSSPAQLQWYYQQTRAN